MLLRGAGCHKFELSRDENEITPILVLEKQVSRDKKGASPPRPREMTRILVLNVVITIPRSGKTGFRIRDRKTGFGIENGRRTSGPLAQGFQKENPGFTLTCTKLLCV